MGERAATRSGRVSAAFQRFCDTACYGRARVEPRRPRRRRLRAGADARRDELGHGRDRLALVRAPRRLRRAADDERDLALRRLGEPLGDLARQSRARPPRTASSARGRRRPGGRAAPPRASASVAGSRCGDSNATAACGQRRELVPQRASASLAARQVAEELVPLAREPARDERRLDGRRRRAAPSPRARPRARPRSAARPGR